MTFKERPANWANTIWNQLAHVICEEGREKEFHKLLNRIREACNEADNKKEEEEQKVKEKKRKAKQS